MGISIKIEPEAFQDIQEAVSWYNEKQYGLGQSFFQEIKKCFKKIKINPYYPIRYDNVRCLPLKKFPYMIHFTFSDKNNLVLIRAVLNTSLDPENWKR